MNHSELSHSFLQGVGTEIGASESPIPDITPIYVDKFAEYAGAKCLADFPGEATALPFFDNSLDYVASSHVFEHLANPVRALIEWQRVLKPGGYAYIVVPDRRFTFDRARELTPPSHMLEDYLSQVDDTDDTHIADFVYGIDWNDVSPGLTEQEAMAQRNANAEFHRNQCRQGREINIHFHVFEPGNFIELIRLARESEAIPFSMNPVKVIEQFPDPVKNGFLVILQKPKTVKAMLMAALSRRRRRELASPAYPVNSTLVGAFK